MSTRGIYTFIDTDGEKYNVYVQCDNYPAGALNYIEAALQYAWELPRFEADEFAAAFVRAAKGDRGGNVRLLNGKSYKVGDMGSQYHYKITMKNGELFIEFKGFSGTLKEMQIKIFDEEESQSETKVAY